MHILPLLLIIFQLQIVTYYLHVFISALSEKECELWIKGLRHLVQDTINAPYPLQVERWLRKEFYTMENSRETQVSFLTKFILNLHIYIYIYLFTYVMDAIYIDLYRLSTYLCITTFLYQLFMCHQLCRLDVSFFFNAG